MNYTVARRLLKNILHGIRGRKKGRKFHWEGRKIVDTDTEALEILTRVTGWPRSSQGWPGGQGTDELTSLELLQPRAGLGLNPSSSL